MKPTLPQGTRDFSAATIRMRQYILTIIRDVFELYGFEPLETPAMENLDTLLGKYGEEGDKLIFKILNNGLDNPAKREDVLNAFDKIMEGKNSKVITERALRYDLTIPFARYVAMNFGQLTLPFKRYQMQPVWRADRPQKGRYREFYQCDADVVGSNSLLSDAEMISIYVKVFEKLKIPKFNFGQQPEGYFININNRKILAALAEICQSSDKLTEITTAIDKIDKIGIVRVKEELFSNGLRPDQVEIIEKYLSLTGLNHEIISKFKDFFGKNSLGKRGIEELEFIINTIPTENFIQLSPTLARGLNYYTGLIVEVKMTHSFQIGSIGGGGRYDDLTGLFDLPGIPGVGISFGVDRIYDVMQELKIFPADIHKSTTVLFFNLGKKEAEFAFRQMQILRGDGISCELYYEPAKLDKQFKYANRKNIAYAVIIGSEELSQNTCVVKDLLRSRQETISATNLSSYFSRQ
jgi:histidyl-tRNA synthetase